MPREALFTMKLEPELRAEVEAVHRPAAEVVRELMREFVRRQRDARDYDAFLLRKVEGARAQKREGHHFSNEEVKAETRRSPSGITP